VSDESPLSPVEQTFAEEVRRLRVSCDWTLADMAEQLRSAGAPHVNHMTVSRIENLKRPVRMIEAEAYSEVFDVPVAMLMNPDTDRYYVTRAPIASRDVTRKLDDAMRAVREVLAAQKHASMIRAQVQRGIERPGGRASPAARRALVELEEALAVDVDAAVAEATEEYREWLEAQQAAWGAHRDDESLPGFTLG
jgi:transcriptional regulator with XRE-family HTH domain